MKKVSVFLIILLILVLTSCRQATSVETPSAEPLVALTETPDNEPTLPQKDNDKGKEIFFSTHFGLILVTGNDRDFGYGVGQKTNPRQTKSPLFEFPIFVSALSNVSQEKDRTLAIIPNPNIEQIGEEWEKLVVDPDYPDHVIKVKLIRVKEEYKYIVETSFSPDGGETWWDPMIYPFELMNKEG